MTLFAKDTHGMRSRYVNGPCRCAPCCDANAEYQKALKNKLHERGKHDPALIPHGTIGGYTNWKCRCEECTVENTEAGRRGVARRALARRALAS